jgi:hypothetical protein
MSHTPTAPVPFPALAQYKTASAQTWDVNGPGQRTDATIALTSGSATVADASIVSGDAGSLVVSGVAISSVVSSGGTTTFTTAIPHALTTGQTVTPSGLAGGAGYSTMNLQQYSCTVTGTSTFTIPTPSGVSGTATASTGTVTSGHIPPNTFVGTVTGGTSFLLSSSPTTQVNVNALATQASSASLVLYIGHAITLFSDSSGPGMLNSQWLAMAGATVPDAILAITTDGHSTPDVFIDVATLFLQANDAWTQQTETRRTYGTVAVAGAGAYTVNHNLPGAPYFSPDIVLLTPEGTSVTASEAFWVTNLNTTTFTVNVLGSYTGSLYWEAILDIGGSAASTKHMHVITEGKEDQFCGVMKFPVPYSSSVLVQLYNPGFDTSLGAAPCFYQTQHMPGVTQPYRLHSVGVTQPNALSANAPPVTAASVTGGVATITAPGQWVAGSQVLLWGFTGGTGWTALNGTFVTIASGGNGSFIFATAATGTPTVSAAFVSQSLTYVDITTSTRSWLVWFGLCGQGVYNDSWMERSHYIFVDGESTASYQSTGTEDFFQSAWYFENRENYSTPWSMLTTGNNSDLTFNAGLDLLELTGGVLFGSQLQIVAETKYTCASTSVKTSFVALYYAETS